MKTTLRQLFKNTLYVSMLLISICLLVSCNEDVTVKQDFDFNIRMQKYRTDVNVGAPANLVFFIDSEGNYSDTHYSVSYFLRKGNGLLRNEDNVPLADNTLYDIRNDTLQISYTPIEKGEHVIEVEFKDNFNQTKETVITLSAN